MAEKNQNQNQNKSFVVQWKESASSSSSSSSRPFRRWKNGNRCAVRFRVYNGTPRLYGKPYEFEMLGLGYLAPQLNSQGFVSLGKCKNVGDLESYIVEKLDELTV